MKREERREKSHRAAAAANHPVGNLKLEAREMSKGRGVYFFAVICCLLFVAGCQSPVTSGDKKGSFSLTIADADRTILPDTPGLNDFAVYTLAFTPASGGGANSGVAASADRTNETLPANPVLLEPGTYNLVVNAYKDNAKNQLMARGTLDGIIITAGQRTSAAVTLEALLSGGMGTFRWDITLPTGVTANMIITPGSASGTNQQTVTLALPSASGNRALNSGQYSLTFNLNKTDGKSVVWYELLYVYQNLESVFSFTFTDAHLSDSAYTVTFNGNGGQSPEEWGQSVLHGATITQPADPARNFYTFSGWYTDNDTFANAWDFDNPVIESFTLYAKWEPIFYTVTFNSNGGNGITPSSQTVQEGSSIILPGGNGLSMSDCAFGGWNTSDDGTGTEYSAGSSYTVTADITLYARWDSVVSGTSLADKLAWLQSNAQSNGGYIIEVDADESIEPHTLSYSNRSSITITLIGVGANQTVSLSSNGTMFTVLSGVTLVLDDNITLRGRSSNNNSLVWINSDGTLIMKVGSTISDNTAIGYGNGGGVYVDSGTFTMEGGEISGNTAGYYGGGVYVGNSGTFTMEGGEISGNTAGYYGGGVYVGNSGTFTMEGGEISGNTAGYGGGVCVASGTFTMEGGEISGNTGNSSISCGGGVYVGSSGTFTMEGGEISGNTASSSSSSDYGGGGVYVGVYLSSMGYESGTFRIVTGTIYGSDGEASLRNTARFGAALYSRGGSQHGTFSGTTWISKGVLFTNNNTIRVVNGELQ